MEENFRPLTSKHRKMLKTLKRRMEFLQDREGNALEPNHFNRAEIVALKFVLGYVQEHNDKIVAEFSIDGLSGEEETLAIKELQND